MSNRPEADPISPAAVCDGTRATASPPAAPTASQERVVSLDVLRGLALLGILVMNIQAFSMPLAAYVNPTVWGGLEGANYWVWLVGHLLTDQKMMAIFSMLFGAGILIFAERAEARGGAATRLHFRRTFWLLLFGAAHGYLLWFGDILFLYAVCAAAVFWFRRLPPPALLILGVAVLAVSSALYLLLGMSLPQWPPEQLAQFIEQDWQPGTEYLAREISAYQGGWLQQMEVRVPTTMEFQTFILAIWGFWRAAGLMLVGMGLYKLGVLSAQCRPRFYMVLVGVAVLIGIPVVGYGVYWNFANDWGPLSSFYGTQFNYLGGLLVSLGWVGAVMLVCQRDTLKWLTRRLAAVGRTAFSNYILQTLICTTLFYGHGLGLFSQVERTGQILIVFGIWTLQLTLSPIWLRHFRFGPLEWLWRCLTYGRLQAIRRY